MVGRIASETNYDQFETDLSGRANPESLRAWANVVRSAPLIPKAMEFTTAGGAYNNLVRAAFWSKMEAAEAAGRVQPNADLADAPDPALSDGAVIIYYTRAEAIDALAAKWVHALWVEKNRFFPWRLTGMSFEELQYLFQPDILFHSGASTGPAGSYDLTSETQAIGESLVLDNCPYKAWDVAGTGTGGLLENFSGSLMAHASYEFYKEGANWGHSAAGTIDRLNAAHMDDLHDPAINKVFLNGDPRPTFCARTGCQFTGRLWTAWHRAVNIPASYERHVYAGTGHGSSIVFLDGTGYVLPHADYIYNTATRYYGADTDSWDSGGPVGVYWPYDYQFSSAGWTESWRSIKETYPYNDAGRISYSQRGNWRTSFGPNIVFGDCGRILPNIVTVYENNGWSYLVNNWLGDIGVQVAKDAAQARLIKITGQDIP